MKNWAKEHLVVIGGIGVGIAIIQVRDYSQQKIMKCVQLHDLVSGCYFLYQVSLAYFLDSWNDFCNLPVQGNWL